jgi:cellulose synthase/poly-beta-1,6-N-acetylglucosamine synthase-like glycosyltransferase
MDIVFAQMVRWLLPLVEVALALPVIYLCALSVGALTHTLRRRTIAKEEGLHHRFAILIPAHNESAVITKLLDSLLSLEYPATYYSIHVVADNCTDDTALLARRYTGVAVYERTECNHRGKGYALNWLFAQLGRLQASYDAYVIFDADSVVDPRFLVALNSAILAGARALQGRYTVLNPTDSTTTALRWIALALKNHVRQMGRFALGASATLTGNGMCFLKDVLDGNPWQAFSITEDDEYYLTLVRNGERIWYIPDAVVQAVMPQTFADMRSQEIRWSGATLRAKVQTMLGLVALGIRNTDFVRFEAAIEWLLPPLSFLVGWCVLVLAASVFVGSWLGLYFGLVLAAGISCYVATAFYLLRPPRAIYWALIQAPRFMLWKMWVLFVVRPLERHAGEWIRTNRGTQ